MPNSQKLKAKIFFRGEIELLTGLHIGGSKNSLDIGGIDLNVIKTPVGIPFIPGSSIKGKIRSLLAKIEGSQSIDQDSDAIKQLFGFPGKGKNEPGTPAQLIVRDAHLDKEHFRNYFPQLAPEWTEAKWENTINRLTGTAEHPRQLERVPAGARFFYELVYNKYSNNENTQHEDLILKALDLLQDDYLGGQGSRGYGKILFHPSDTVTKDIGDYDQSFISTKPA